MKEDVAGWLNLAEGVHVLGDGDGHSGVTVQEVDRVRYAVGLDEGFVVLAELELASGRRVYSVHVRLSESVAFASKVLRLAGFDEFERCPLATPGERVSCLWRVAISLDAGKLPEQGRDVAGVFAHQVAGYVPEMLTLERCWYDGQRAIGLPAIERLTVTPRG